MPSISERIHIRWGTELAKEPTSTLVLTSAKSKFVDIRIFKAIGKSEPILPNYGGPMSRLEWAFGGVSKASLVQEGPPPILHSVWDHWVDSKVIPGEQAPIDQGDIFPQMDTDVSLEYGSMVNPENGIMTKYEEAWRDIPSYETGHDGAIYSVVLTIEQLEKQTRGMIVRVGQYCQGILKIGDEVSVERWEYIPSNHAIHDRGGSDPFSAMSPRTIHRNYAAEGDWTRQVKLGSRFIPCAYTFSVDDVKVGDTVTTGDFKWVVQEKDAWRENTDEPTGVVMPGPNRG